MIIQRVFLLFALALLLTACYQETGETFESVNSQPVGGAAAQSAPSNTPSSVGLNPTVIVPTVATITPIAIVPTTVVPSATPSQLPFDTSASPTATQPLITVASSTPTIQAVAVVATATQTLTATPTVLVISLPTNTATLPPTATHTPTQSAVLVPTATSQVVTPQPPSQITFPTPSPTITPLPSATFTASPTLTDTDPCVYVIQRGDTLFRIAQSNGVRLATLLSENNLSEDSIIQPGQRLRIPDCVSTVAGATGTPSVNAQAVNATSAPNATATVAPTLAGTVEYTVKSGDTLSGIASRYGVTVGAIVRQNNLTNPDNLRIGQKLVIPNQP